MIKLLVFLNNYLNQEYIRVMNIMIDIGQEKKKTTTKGSRDFE